MVIRSEAKVGFFLQKKVPWNVQRLELESQQY
jgi:hypothetical protein